MTPQLPEREILNFHPHIFKTIAFFTGFGFIIFFVLAWKPIVAGDFSNPKVIKTFLLLIMCIIASNVRIILSTRSIQQKFGPFFGYEIQRSLVEAIKITPTHQYLQKKSHPILFKSLFNTKKEVFDLNYWSKQGILHFIHSEKISTLFKASLTDIQLWQLSDTQSEQLIRHLVRDWQLAKPSLENEFPSTSIAIAQQNDIGKYALILLGLSAFILLTALLIPIFLLKSPHFAVESYVWIIPCFIVAIILSFVVIRREDKSYSFITSILVGSILGACLYFFVLQINRFYSELAPQKNFIVELKLIDQNDDYQTWQLPEELKDKTGLTAIYIAKKWQNPYKVFKFNHSYPITIHQGLFTDYWINPNEFK